MNLTRRSGILLHPTSLPESYGIGTLGKSAYKFVDWLCEAKQTLWQILPLGPTGYGDSPYASFSTFAGNPLLIDLDLLVEKNWANKIDIVIPDFIKINDKVDFGAVVFWKIPTLEKCATYFLDNCNESDKAIYNEYKKINDKWLNQFAIFMSLKNYFDKKAQEENTSGIWHTFWPREYALCDKKSLSKWEGEHKTEIEIIKVIQFFFESQWSNLKKYANDKGIQIIGDIPIFVAPDSADVWANQKFFQLDENAKPKNVAGVPPDYFSETGQLWGNPLYNWDTMKEDKYSWWIARIQRVLSLVDVVRIDHFRGFESYWSIPFGEETAVNGKWEKCPGIDFFETVKMQLGDIPVIAEDLGVITDEVKSLRNICNFPGMKVLQFAFDPNEAGGKGMTNDFLPHEYKTSNCIVYTGTHDNDTLQGWLLRSSNNVAKLVACYITGKYMSDEEVKNMVFSGELCNEIIRLAFSSSASYAIIPLQDILCLDNNSRMNTPSTTGANWAWRMTENAISNENTSRLIHLCKIYGRNI